MEIVIVSDTNIFIDLIEIGLIDEFFSLPWEIHTTDMIIHELKDPEQKRVIVAYMKKRILHVKTYDETEINSLAVFHTKMRRTTNVSIQDCSVWLYAQNMGYTLLTGDAKLRSAATKTGIEVHGILFVIDKLVENNLLSMEQATKKLKDLTLSNPRLPLSEINKRLLLWSGTKRE